MKLKSSVYANVLNPIFTSKELAGSGGMFVEIVILIYIFCGFGVICDKFLIPAIEKIKEKYNISERLAGATILALGSSISEIASNMNSVLLNKPEEFELGLSGIVGGAVFELSVGLAIGCFLIKKKYIINYANLKRDLIIYIFIIILLALFIRTKNIDMFKVNNCLT
jgi:cation:H+ antiporter